MEAQVNIPKELQFYFNQEDFVNYPVIRIPQQFSDERGLILNLAGGILGDVSVISSKKNSVRANHYHKKDWHLCYILSGNAEYFWSDVTNQNTNKIQISAGQMLFTPTQTAHKFIFFSNTQLITISKLMRKKILYDSDTVKIELK